MNNYSLSVACVFAITALLFQGADGLTCKVCTAGTGTSTCTTGASTCTASNGWCYNMSVAGAWSQNCYGSGITGYTNSTNITAGCTTTTAVGVTTSYCFCNSKDQCNSSPITFAPSMFIVLFAMVSMFAVNGIAKW